MTNTGKLPIVVLISGSGSNLQAIIDAIASGVVNANIQAVISDQASAFGLQRAQQHDIPIHVVAGKDYASRELYDQALLQSIQQYSPQLVVLAGFMRILTAEFVNAFAGKMINIHPSLLPKYKGLHTHQRVLAAGDKEHGITIHFVTAELDGGPIIVQKKLTIHENDSEQSLQQRVHKLEHDIYPQVIQWFAQGQLHLTAEGVILKQD